MGIDVATLPAPVLALPTDREVGATRPLVGLPVVVAAIADDTAPRVRCTQPGRNSYEFDPDALLEHITLLVDALTRVTPGGARLTRLLAIRDLLTTLDREEVTPLPPAG